MGIESLCWGAARIMPKPASKPAAELKILKKEGVFHRCPQGLSLRVLTLSRNLCRAPNPAHEGTEHPTASLALLSCLARKPDPKGQEGIAWCLIEASARTSARWAEGWDRLCALLTLPRGRQGWSFLQSKAELPFQESFPPTAPMDDVVI